MKTPRLHVLSSLFILFALAPTSAFADDGAIQVHLANADKGYLIAAILVGIVSIFFGLFLRSVVMKVSPGSESMKDVGKAIREGALAYLFRQMRMMVWFVIGIAIGLFFLYFKSVGKSIALGVSFSFIAGVCCSYFAGFTGMLMAVEGNMRTANAAITSYRRALETAFRSGAVTGLMTVGLGLTGASAIFYFGGNSAMRLLVGFGFGSSLAALFMRVGGGIFTKAADVGADLVGKVEAGIPEDDPRNPAVIADNVGDNVGDCAGMAADVFESYSVTLVASIVLGSATSTVFPGDTWMKLVIYAFMICAVGILASIVGIFAVRGTDNLQIDPIARIRTGFYIAATVGVIGIAAVSFILFGKGKVPFASVSLKSTAEVERNEFEQILNIRKAIAKEDKVPVYTLQALDLKNDSAIKALGYNKNNISKILQDAINYHKSQTPPVPDLSEYRPVNGANPKDPVLNYTVISNSNLPNKPKFQSVKQMFFDNGKPIPFSVYDLTLTQLKPVANQSVQPPQEVVIGPISNADMDSEISKATQTGALAIKVDKLIPVQLYQGDEGRKLLFGIDGQVEPDTMAAQNYEFTTADPATIKKLTGDTAAIQAQKIPPVSSIGMAIVSTHKIPFYWMLAPVVFGILLCFGIEKLTDYYVSTQRKPVQEVAGVATAGAAPMIIQGFSFGLESSVFMVLSIVIALLVPLWIFPPSEFGTYILSFYGIALVGLGLLTTTGFVLAMDTFGPISDNAQGVFEMSGEGKKSDFGMSVVSKLDAAGNTTKALTKGFAITTAVIAAVALFHSFLQDAHLASIGLRLDFPEIFLGLLIGGAAPFLFSAFSINAVGRAAFQLINEVRKQFHEHPGIMKGTDKPDYAACVSIVTAAAQKELLGPGILAIFLPIAVGFGFSIGKPVTVIDGHYFNLAGAEALGGFLAGAIVSGQLMAVLLANSGGLWDNSKKLIEDGMHGGKGTDAHKASVVCDTVGDPFKDTAGPALNPLIKVMNLVALLMAPIITLPYGNMTLSVITAICVGLLGIAVYLSKKGSLSEGFQSVKVESVLVSESQQVPTKKKIIRVEEDDEDTTLV